MLLGLHNCRDPAASPPSAEAAFGDPRSFTEKQLKCSSLVRKRIVLGLDPDGAHHLLFP